MIIKAVWTGHTAWLAGFKISSSLCVRESETLYFPNRLSIHDFNYGLYYSGLSNPKTWLLKSLTYDSVGLLTKSMKKKILKAAQTPKHTFYNERYLRIDSSEIVWCHTSISSPVLWANCWDDEKMVLDDGILRKVWIDSLPADCGFWRTWVAIKRQI